MPPDQIFDRVAPGVWSLAAYDASKKLLASASGVVIAPGKLVTSCQVLARARKVQVRLGDTIYDARLEYPDIERDLCQFDVPGLKAPEPVVGSARGLRPGQRLYVVGFSRGKEQSIGEGLVSAVSEAGTGKERIQTTVPAAPGLRGAGVFDDEARLVGIVTSSPADAAATAFAVPADWLAELAARGSAALAARAKSMAARAGAGSAAPGLPAAGTTWVYGFKDRQYGRRQIDVTVRAVRVDGSLVYEAVTSTGPDGQDMRRTVSAGEAQFLTHRPAEGAELTEFAPYILAANGDNASTVAITAAGYPVGSGNPPWTTRTVPPIWEQVTVPAGTFKALRLEIRGRRSSSASVWNTTNRFLVRVWYAPEVKRYVRLERKEWLSRGLASDDVVELEKFSPPS